jgi:hypothetical protein
MDYMDVVIDLHGGYILFQMIQSMAGMLPTWQIVNVGKLFKNVGK